MKKRIAATVTFAAELVPLSLFLTAFFLMVMSAWQPMAAALAACVVSSWALGWAARRLSPREAE